MKLPKLDLLDNDYFRSLYDHDIREYHSEQVTGYSLFYKEKLKYTMDAVERYCQPGAQVLDLGCSQANASLVLAEKGYRAVPADLRTEPLGYAKLKYERGLFYPTVCNVEQLPFKPVFDAVIAGEIVEHMAYPENLFAQCRDVLKTKGILILTTPNGSFFRSKLPCFREIAENRETIVERQFEPDEDGHLFLFNEKEIVRLLWENGFNVIHFSYLRSLIYCSNQLFGFLIKCLGVARTMALHRWICQMPRINRRLCFGLALVARRQ